LWQRPSQKAGPFWVLPFLRLSAVVQAFGKKVVFSAVFKRQAPENVTASDTHIQLETMHAFTP
jgi:hypothetical protein